MDFKNLKILVVGDIMLDEYIHGISERISPEAPVPVVLVKENSFNLGGAANVANNCASLGASVTLIGISGLDDAGKKISLNLKKKNINYLGPTIAETITTRKVRILSKSQQLLRVDYEKKTFTDFKNIFNLFKSVVNKNDIIIFSDYGKGSLDKIEILISEAKKNNKIVCVDPVGYEFSKYAFTDFLKPNQKELIQAIGIWIDEKDLKFKLHRLMKDYNIKNLILTQSEKGCKLFFIDKDEVKMKLFPVKKREVYDVTGAGDAFISVFSLMIAKKMDVNKAIEAANKGAGFAVEKLGTYNVKHTDIF